MDAPDLEQTNLVLRPRGGCGEKVYWDAQWRYRTVPSEPWQMKKKRLGLAWLEPDGSGGVAQAHGPLSRRLAR